MGLRQAPPGRQLGCGRSPRQDSCFCHSSFCPLALYRTQVWSAGRSRLAILRQRLTVTALVPTTLRMADQDEATSCIRGIHRHRIPGPPFSMLDPITTPLLLLVLGRIGEELLTDACKDFLTDKLKHTFGGRSTLGRQQRRNGAALGPAYGGSLTTSDDLCVFASLFQARQWDRVLAFFVGLKW